MWSRARASSGDSPPPEALRLARNVLDTAFPDRFSGPEVNGETVVVADSMDALSVYLALEAMSEIEVSRLEAQFGRARLESFDDLVTLVRACRRGG